MTASTDVRALPAGFEDFEPFLDWALPTQTERNVKKMGCTMEQLTALYELGVRDGRVLEALRHCDQYPLDDQPQDVRNLFLITLSIAELRPQVELYKQVAPPPHATHPSKMRRFPQADAL